MDVEDGIKGLLKICVGLVVICSIFIAFVSVLDDGCISQRPSRIDTRTYCRMECDTRTTQFVSFEVHHFPRAEERDGIVCHCKVREDSLSDPSGLQLRDGERIYFGGDAARGYWRPVQRIDWADAGVRFYDGGLYSTTDASVTVTIYEVQP